MAKNKIHPETKEVQNYIVVEIPAASTEFKIHWAIYLKFLKNTKWSSTSHNFSWNLIKK